MPRPPPAPSRVPDALTSCRGRRCRGVPGINRVQCVSAWPGPRARGAARGGAAQLLPPAPPPRGCPAPDSPGEATITAASGTPNPPAPHPTPSPQKSPPGEGGVVFPSQSPRWGSRSPPVAPSSGCWLGVMNPLGGGVQPPPPPLHSGGGGGDPPCPSWLPGTGRGVGSSPLPSLEGAGSGRARDPTGSSHCTHGADPRRGLPRHPWPRLGGRGEPPPPTSPRLPSVGQRAPGAAPGAALAAAAEAV